MLPPLSPELNAIPVGAIMLVLVCQTTRLRFLASIDRLQEKQCHVPLESWPLLATKGKHRRLVEIPILLPSRINRRSCSHFCGSSFYSYAILLTESDAKILLQRRKPVFFLHKLQLQNLFSISSPLQHVVIDS
jgi:hypothetical protein